MYIIFQPFKSERGKNKSIQWNIKYLLQQYAKIIWTVFTTLTRSQVSMLKTNTTLNHNHNCDWQIASMLISWWWQCIQFYKTLLGLSKWYIKSLCIISYKCICIYKIKSFVKNCVLFCFFKITKSFGKTGKTSTSPQSDSSSPSLSLVMRFGPLIFYVTGQAV